MFYSHSKQCFLEGIKCLKENVNADQFANYLQQEDKVIEVRSSNRSDNAIYYKTLPNPLAQPKQKCKCEFLNGTKFEGIFFKNIIYAAWI